MPISLLGLHIYEIELCYLCLIIQKKKADINVPIANLYKTIFVFLTPNTKDILENINIEYRLLGLILSKAGTF